MDVIISKADFEQIMMPLGFPVVSLAEISGGSMSEEQARMLLIWPALQDYYKFFPIEEQVETYVAGNFTVGFPDEFTYGVTDARLVNRPVGAPMLSSSPFANEIFFRTGNNDRAYGTQNDYGFNSMQTLDRMASLGNIEALKSVKVRVDHQRKLIEGYTSIAGRMVITWAKFSNDFSQVAFYLQRDLIRLAQSYAMEFFGRLRQQSAAQLPTDLSGDVLVETAKSQREEVIESWKSATKVVIIRN